MISDQGQMEVSEILSIFDLGEIENFINLQIFGDTEDHIPVGDTIDLFHPLYLDYKELIRQTDDFDTIKEINFRFESICNIFLEAIKKKYCVEISDEWLNDNPNEIPSLTLAFYTFFVLNHQSNVEEFLVNYIKNNKEKLYSEFESLKQKKDSSTLANKKLYGVEYGIIFSNIYDICAYILDNTTPLTFFEYLDPDYIPLQIIKKLYESCDIGPIYGDEFPTNGKDFMDVISESFKDNTAYKASICFEVQMKLKESI